MEIGSDPVSVYETLSTVPTDGASVDPTGSCPKTDTHSLWVRNPITTETPYPLPIPLDPTRRPLGLSEFLLQELGPTSDTLSKSSTIPGPGLMTVFRPPSLFRVSANLLPSSLDRYRSPPCHELEMRPHRLGPPLLCRSVSSRIETVSLYPSPCRCAWTKKQGSIPYAIHRFQDFR